jgi:hypothetical protein
MDSNIASQQDFSDNLPLTEPHFDEEATLLSARPVVPLEEIKNGQRLGSRLVFGLAIIASLILGALGAKFIYRSGNEATVVVSDAAQGGAASIDEPAQAPSIVEGAAGATTEGLPSATNATSAEVKTEPQTAVNSEPVRKAVKRQKATVQSSDESEFQQERRSADHRFERDRERDERRETRWRRRRSADGLTRIREIFEGPTRP